MAGLLGELGRTTSELSDLRLRYEGALQGAAQLQQAVQSLGGELRQQDTRVASLSQQLAEQSAATQDTRARVGALADDVHRAMAERTGQVQAQVRLV